MTGDKLILKPIHYKKSKQVLKALIPFYFREKFTVTIGGESGTGKTEIASLLQESLWSEHKIRSKVLHIDDFYTVLWQSRNETRKKKGLDSVGIKEIDWEKVNKIIEDFYNTSKKYLDSQRIHKYVNAIEYCKISNKHIDILIIEGLYANCLNEIDLKVYLEGSIKETKLFREERGKEKIDKFRIKVLNRERKEVLKTKKDIDLLIPFK